MFTAEELGLIAALCDSEMRLMQFVKAKVPPVEIDGETIRLIALKQKVNRAVAQAAKEEQMISNSKEVKK